MEGEQRFVSAIGGAVMDTQHARPINLKQLKADSETVELLFQTILGRPIGNDEYKKGLGGWESVHYWVHRLLNSEEFRTRYIRKHQLFQDGAEFIPNERYRTPAICPLAMPSRVLVTGSCMTNSWKSNIERAFPNVEVLHQLFNNASELEDLPEVELRKASFQIVQISLRSVMGEIDYFSAPLSDSEK